MVLNGFNLGDALFQLISLVFITLIIALIVSFFYYTQKRKNQLNRMEKKIDDMNERIKKGI